MNILKRLFQKAPHVPDVMEQRATALLRPLFEEEFRVMYDPAFPLKVGTTVSWFQVIFAVGPVDAATARAHVHECFIQFLSALAPLPEVQQAGTVSLRARRRAPLYISSDNPRMFIECAWHGSAVSKMQRDKSFSEWHSHCYSYVNRFDQVDPLNLRNRDASSEAN